MLRIHVCGPVPRTHLNDVQDDVLVEAVQDALGHAVVVPGSVDQQQILQVFELRGRRDDKTDEQPRPVYEPNVSS